MIELKHCGKCNRYLPRSAFSHDGRAKDGLQWQCKSCKQGYCDSRRLQERAYAKQYRESHRDKIRGYNEQYQKDNPAKTRAWDQRYKATHRVQINETRRASYHKNPEMPRAHRAIYRAIRDGNMKRRPCEICGATETVEAHHDDYSKPLEVRWLCRMHHKQLHGEERDERKQAI